MLLNKYKDFKWYDNVFKVKYCRDFKVKIKERVYTINNNKLTYEVINTYTDFEMCELI